MKKADPSELRALKTDLDTLRRYHANVIGAEPTVEKLIDDAREFVSRRYDQVRDYEDQSTEGRVH